MGRPPLPAKQRRCAGARICFTKSEHAQIGRVARIREQTVSTFVRKAALAALAADAGQEARSC